MIELEDLPELRDPVLIAAFEGWNDAGEAASGAIEHLRGVWGAELLAELDPEEYYDYQVNRPHVSIDASGIRQVTWPATRLFVARLPSRVRDVVLIQGIEPNMKWQQFVREILGLAAELEVSTLVTLGALLSDIPHTRPVPVTGTTSDASLGAELGLEPSTYEVSTNSTAVLNSPVVDVLSGGILGGHGTIVTNPGAAGGNGAEGVTEAMARKARSKKVIR